MPEERPRDVYTHGHHDSVLRSHRWRTAENSAGYLLAHLTPTTRLVDVGCGPGTVSVDLARRVARVVGVDVSADVIAQARDYARATQVDNVEFREGDFRALDRRERFDVVHAHQVLQHLRDPVGALTAMAELAEADGLVAARDSDYPAMAWYPADERLDAWMAVYLAVTRRNGAFADAGRRLVAWAQLAGLHDIVYSTSTWTFATPTDREWWGSLWAERTVASDFARQAVSYGVATSPELEAIATGWREWAARPDGVFIVVHGEIVARPPRV